jgi:hypothetical protein
VNKDKKKGRSPYALAPSYLIAVKVALLRALRRCLLLPFFHSPPQALRAGNNGYGVVVCGVVVCGVVCSVVVDGGGEGDAEDDDAEDDDAEGEGIACLTTPGADLGVTGCCILIGTTR